MDPICEMSSRWHNRFSKRASTSRPRRSLIVDTRAVLGVEVCRTLESMGWQVDVFACRGSPAFLSRACYRRFICKCLGPSYLSELRSIIEQGSYNTIYPCSEEILELLATKSK